MKIWANTIINNEDQFLWYSVMSVVDYVDKILIWDTGSTDKTVQVVKELIKVEPQKIVFKEVGETDRFQFTKMRQEMLEESKCDWLLILDGDEIWWSDSIKKARSLIETRGKELDAIVVPFVVPLGDVYHYQQQQAGAYKLLGKKGHLSLKLFRRGIEGLHTDRPYGSESYFDGDNRLIQDRKNVVFLPAPYFHCTHLNRSSQSRKHNKFKFELGDKFSHGYEYPEVFYQKTPDTIPSPWNKIDFKFWFVGSLLTPLRRLKRRTIRSLKHG